VAALRAREKEHTHAGDAIAAARQRLPMVAVDARTPLAGERGSVTLLDVFEGRRRWHRGKPAAGSARAANWEHVFRRDGRPLAQWPRVQAGHSDRLDGDG
jgi:hypothetical protein